MHLSHYGQLYDVVQRGHDFRRRLDAVVEPAAIERVAGDARHGRIKQPIAKDLLCQIRDHGCWLPEKTLLDIWETDLKLNTQGLVLCLDSAVE
jgi:hypothetical protein